MMPQPVLPLHRHNKADLQILRNTKAAVDGRNRWGHRWAGGCERGVPSVHGRGCACLHPSYLAALVSFMLTHSLAPCSVAHSATILANALMHAGTTCDTFLRDNLEWLARATNWAKFSATAGLGAIHRCMGCWRMGWGREGLGWWACEAHRLPERDEDRVGSANLTMWMKKLTLQQEEETRWHSQCCPAACHTRAPPPLQGPPCAGPRAHGALPAPQRSLRVTLLRGRRAVSSTFVCGGLACMLRVWVHGV